MDHFHFIPWLDSLDFNLDGGEAYQNILPGLPDAFNDERMMAVLADILFDSSHNGTILACESGKGNLQPDLHCRVQYDLKIRDESSGREFETLVNARLFPDLAGCRLFYHQRLEPLAERMAGRPEILPFARPIGIVEPLNMTVSVFPIDGQLPALVEATDCERLFPVFQEILPEVKDGRFAIREIHQDLAHYGRTLRCVLRFRLDGENLETHTPQQVTVYGKVDVDDQGSRTVAVVSAMQALLKEPTIAYPFRIPDTLGYLPTCNMLLMAALPGEPIIKKLNKQLEKGAVPVVYGTTLEEAIAMSARVLATLHGLKIQTGPRRSFSDEIASLQKEIDVVRQVYPALGSQLQSWIDQITQAGENLTPMPLCFSDGDYTNAQLLFDGQNAGLVDFDTVCQAEPGLDIGQFRAYQRLSFEKGYSSGDPALAEKNKELCDLFLDTYIAQAGYTGSSSALLRQWGSIYELTSLLHLVLHSWQKFKGKRLRLALEMLEIQMEHLEQT